MRSVTRKNSYRPCYLSYGYNSTTKRLETITTKSSSSASTTYTFAYDGFGNTTNISVGGRSLAGYSYNSNNGKLNTLTYGNGHKVKYIYDVLDRISKIQYNIGTVGSTTTYGSTSYRYYYDDLTGSVNKLAIECTCGIGINHAVTNMQEQ